MDQTVRVNTAHNILNQTIQLLPTGIPIVAGRCSGWMSRLPFGNLPIFTDLELFCQCRLHHRLINRAFNDVWLHNSLLDANDPDSEMEPTV